MSKVTFAYPASIEVMDRNTKLKGVITSRIQRINGCIQYCVQPPVTENDPAKIPEGWYLDEVQLIQPDGTALVRVNEVYTFEFETGDRVKNRITKQKGIVTIRHSDQNLCERYAVQLEEADKDGKFKEISCFKQELTLVDHGLNASLEAPLKRATTGCLAIKAERTNRAV